MKDAAAIRNLHAIEVLLPFLELHHFLTDGLAVGNKILVRKLVALVIALIRGDQVAAEHLAVSSRVLKVLANDLMELNQYRLPRHVRFYDRRQVRPSDLEAVVKVYLHTSAYVSIRQHTSL